MISKKEKECLLKEELMVKAMLRKKIGILCLLEEGRRRIFRNSREGRKCLSRLSKFQSYNKQNLLHSLLQLQHMSLRGLKFSEVRRRKSEFRSYRQTLILSSQKNKFKRSGEKNFLLLKMRTKIFVLSMQQLILTFQQVGRIRLLLPNKAFRLLSSRLIKKILKIKQSRRRCSLNLSQQFQKKKSRWSRSFCPSNQTQRKIFSIKKWQRRFNY